jgi:hypothetical protein
VITGARVWALLIGLAIAAPVAASLLLGTAACNQPTLTLVPNRAQTPPGIRDACAVAEHKCTKCHDLERIKVSKFTKPQWHMYIDRMRRQPNSGITEGDGVVILKCLVYISKKLPGDANEAGT